MARAAREIRRHARARHRAVRDAVAVDVLVAAPLARAAPASPRRAPCRDRAACSGYANGFDHPGVHAEIEVAHHEHERLEPLGEVERVHRHRVALLDRRGKQQDLLRVAVRQQRGRQDVALRGARRQPGRRADALDVEHDRRASRRSTPRPANSPISEMPGPDVDVIARAPAQPAPTTMPIAAISSSACTIANVALPVVLVHAVLPHVADERFGQRRRRRDRIPRDDRDAGQHAADRRGGVALDQDLPAVLFIRSTRYGIRLVRCSAAYSRRPSSAPMFSSAALTFLPSCLPQRLLHLAQLDARAGARARRRRSCS